MITLRYLNDDLDAARGFVNAFALGAALWAGAIVVWFYVIVPGSL